MAEENAAEVELVAQMKASREQASRERQFRIEQGIPTSTGRSDLGQALKVVRGQDGDLGRRKMSEV